MSSYLGMVSKLANEVLTITTAMSNMDASTILDKIKDGSILKAIGLSKFMKQLAEGCKRLMEKVIELFIIKRRAKLSTTLAYIIKG